MIFTETSASVPPSDETDDACTCSNTRERARGIIPGSVWLCEEIWAPFIVPHSRKGGSLSLVSPSPILPNSASERSTPRRTPMECDFPDAVWPYAMMRPLNPVKQPSTTRAARLVGDWTPVECSGWRGERCRPINSK